MSSGSINQTEGLNGRRYGKSHTSVNITLVPKSSTQRTPLCQAWIDKELKAGLALKVTNSFGGFSVLLFNLKCL